MTSSEPRITVVWVAYLSTAVELSADAVPIVESDFDQVARELRAAAGSVAVNLARHSPVPVTIVP
jgi:nucleotide-binding universal stress UspA family protein